MNAVDSYIATQPPEVQERLQQVRALVLGLVPEPVELVSYGIPTVDWRGKHVIHYAGYARHVGVYPGPEALTALATELTGYKSAKGSVQFPHTAPLPEALIAALVQHRLAALQAQPTGKKRQSKPASAVEDSGNHA